MRFSLVALFFVGATLSAYSQVVPAAIEGNLPFTVGSGFSNFSIDWGQGRRMNGYTVWGDWRLPRLPQALNGLGIEAEGRDVLWNAPPSLSGHRMTTGSGGAIYQWRRAGRIRPYGKFLIGFGSISFPGNVSSPPYTHDTRTIYEPGGGADVLAWNRFSVRAEYDYQFWPNMFGHGSLTPNGFTVGGVYDFGRRPNE